MQSPSYYSAYSNKPIYEFNPVFNLNTEDLSITATGYSVHKSKDVKFVFNITDRELNVLNSTNSITDNIFIKSINIDILDISGNIIYPDYVTGSFKNNFIFTEAENTGIFGEYTKDFGIGISTISSNVNIHSTEYYVYGNPLEIKSISIMDGTGSWLNNNPIQYQSYIPYEFSESLVDAQIVTNNALYLSGYKESVSGYQASISGFVPFKFISGESFKIDWGNSQIDTIFLQTGINDFSGISGVTSISTYTGDLLLNNLNVSGASGVINGKSYDFKINYDYPTGITGIYDVKFYYSGIGSTGNELIKTTQYRIPDELKEQGKPQIGSSLTGKIKFDIEFENDPLYSFQDKFEIFASIDNSSPVLSGDINKIIPILNNSKNYSFYLNQNTLSPNTNYWFSVIPYGQIDTGYAWKIGPYSIYNEPIPKTNIATESFTLVNGEARMDLDFLTGIIINDQITIIDSIVKGSRYSYEYLSQFKDQSGCYCSSKLLILDNTSGLDLLRTGLSFSEYAISDDSFVNYSISGDPTNIYLTAQLNSYTGTYKLYKTSI